MENQFQRTELLIGHEAMERLYNKKVAVFGIGGVGGFVVEALARIGIGNFVFVDSDVVDVSNINRQIIATHKNLGRAKVQVMAERVKDINPNVKVDCFEEFYLPENADKMIDSSYDYIVDAIDTVSAKISLISNAKNKGIPIISCMGMGNKLNPMMIEVADIYNTSVCKLARVMRQELRKRDINNVKVVYSKEEAVKVEGSVVGSVSFVPSVAGLIIASEIVKEWL